MTSKISSSEQAVYKIAMGDDQIYLLDNAKIRTVMCRYSNHMDSLPFTAVKSTGNKTNLLKTTYLLTSDGVQQETSSFLALPIIL